ncbi:MAG: hypothetical protein ACJA2Q_000249 [Pseudohongiellaceae bacterium]|jgi:hypothetical protein
MKNRRIKNLSMSALALLISSFLGFAQAAEIIVDSSILDQAMDVIAEKYSDSAQAQSEITRLQNDTSSVFEEFKRENDNLESLLVVNAGFRKQIANQEQQIITLDNSIASVAEVTREIPLLMEKMLASIEQFIELDYPFHIDQRRARVQFARDAIDNPDVSIAEKFRQVLVMYQTETSYGRTFETFPDTISISGAERDVTLARYGRVALMYQTTDRQVTGAWDNIAREWVELPAGDYRSAIQKAIRIAQNLDAPDIINLPVIAPEAAR